MHAKALASVVSGSVRSYRPQPISLLCPWDSPGKSTEVGSHSLLEGIFPTQGLNSGLLNCKADSLPSETPRKPSLFFLLQVPLQLYGYATYCLYTYLLIDIQIVSRYWLLWTKLLWICRFKSSFSQEIPRSGLAGSFLVGENCQKVFSVVAPVHIPTSSVWEFLLFCVLINLVFFLNFSYSSRC